MNDLTIDIDEELHAVLHRQAGRHGVAVEEEARRILVQVLRAETPPGPGATPAGPEAD
ncbi:MAG: hypothetical protein J0H15_00175 [Xanthomonadales bacterium]|nr:hypothetical protein [Xanthomonadales bacterium]